MELLFTLIEIGLALFFLSLLFIPMEKVFPAKKGQKVFRQAWLVDLSFLLGQYLLWHGLVAYVLGGFEAQLQRILPAAFQQAIAAQPMYLQIIEVILFSDLLIYSGPSFSAQQRVPLAIP
jgi:sterol desaturase/sphingolipid hydroxylase (fatty acid hydroxylase superfamily)